MDPWGRWSERTARHRGWRLNILGMRSGCRELFSGSVGSGQQHALAPIVRRHCRARRGRHGQGCVRLALQRGGWHAACWPRGFTVLTRGIVVEGGASLFSEARRPICAHEAASGGSCSAIAGTSPPQGKCRGSGVRVTIRLPTRAKPACPTGHGHHLVRGADVAIEQADAADEAQGGTRTAS